MFLNRSHKIVLLDELPFKRANDSLHIWLVFGTIWDKNLLPRYL